MGTLATLLTSIGDVITFLFEQFADFIEIIVSNPLFLLPVIMGFSGTIVFLVIKIIRKFGVGRKKA